jgi:hypothetical protein
MNRLAVSRHFSTSILLWMRSDRPRQAGMDHWQGPHSGIISATPGLEEYRQIHLAEDNPGHWPRADGIETEIPPDRKADGVAEVTFASLLSPTRGRRQTKLAFRDEVNVFRRTLLYAAIPGASRWYHVADGADTGARAVVYLRKRPGTSGRAFRRFVERDLVTHLARSTSLTELRTQVYLPWSKATWNTPDVAHDNPPDQRFHASSILGFPTQSEREAYFANPHTALLTPVLAPFISAIHAYDVATTLTFVEHRTVLPAPHS